MKGTIVKIVASILFGVSIIFLCRSPLLFQPYAQNTSNSTGLLLTNYKQSNQSALILPDSWPAFRLQLGNSPYLLNHINNLNISTIPRKLWVCFTIDEAFKDLVFINKTTLALATKDLGPLFDFYSDNHLVFHLKIPVISFIRQWQQLLDRSLNNTINSLINSTTENREKPHQKIFKYDFKSLKIVSKSKIFPPRILMTSVIVIFFILLLRDYIKWTMVNFLTFFFKDSDEVRAFKLKVAVQNFGLKKFLPAFGTFCLENLFLFFVLFFLIDSWIEPFFVWEVLESSDHQLKTSWTEFSEVIVPSASIEKVVIDTIESTASVQIREWSNSTSILLKDLKNFYFTFLSATALESKLEILVKSIPLNNQFPWSIVIYSESKSSRSLFGVPIDILINIITFMVLIWVQTQMNGGGLLSQGFLVVETDIPIRFRDVAGLDEAKGEIMEIVDILRNPKKYHDMGAKIPKGVLLSGPSGTGKTLLAKAVAGESGCSFLTLSGSSFVEMYVGVGASRVRRLFSKARKSAPCIIFIDEIDALGQRGKNHQESDTTLNQLLVEMDGFPSDVGMDKSNIVIVMAATNRPQLIDSALKRPGRFDRHVSVALPDKNGRRDIFKVHLQTVNLSEDFDIDEVKEEKKTKIEELSSKPPQPPHSTTTIENSITPKAHPSSTSLEGSVGVFPPCVVKNVNLKSKKSMMMILPSSSSTLSNTGDFFDSSNELLLPRLKQSAGLIALYADKLSGMTTGFSGADIKNICNEAAILTCRSNDSSISLKHFDDAIERVIAGISKDSNTISVEEKKILAHHEAGHATISYFVEHSDPLVKVSIVPRSGVSKDGSGGQTLGFAQYAPQDKYMYSKEQIMDKMCVALGGRIAEQIFFESITSGAQDDLQKVTGLAYWQVRELGMADSIGWLSFQIPGQGGEKGYSEETAAMMDKEVRALVLVAQKRTMELMLEHREDVLKIANYLLENEVLLKEDIVKLLGPRPFDEKIKKDL